MSKWTDEEKAEVVARYQEIMQNDFDNDEDRASHSVEVVNDIAKEIGKTPNGVRIVLMHQDAYIKATPASKPKTASTTKRVSKADAQKELKTAIASVDKELVDVEIIEKLTGKAAVYFTGVIHQIVSAGE